MRLTCRLLCGALLIAGLLAFPAAAAAADGKTEISQAKVWASGGFPYNINASGAYVLTSNLDVTKDAAGNPTTAPQDITAIGVAASHVSVDLNGFSIIGPNTVAGTGHGVYSSGDHVRIFNGQVIGMGRSGVRVVGSFATVDSLQVKDCKARGISLETGGTIRNSFVRGTEDATLPAVECSLCTISGNTVEANTRGIEAFSAIIEGNIVKGNSLEGVKATWSTVSRNTILQNGSTPANGALWITGGCNVHDNVIQANFVHGVYVQGANLVARNVIAINGTTADYQLKIAAGEDATETGLAHNVFRGTNTVSDGTLGTWPTELAPNRGWTHP